MWSESIRLSDGFEATRLVGASMNVLVEILKLMPKISVKVCSTGLKLSKAYNTLKTRSEPSGQSNRSLALEPRPGTSQPLGETLSKVLDRWGMPSKALFSQ